MKAVPAAVPEIPVTDMEQALDYYERKLRFNTDWGGADGGIAGISKGHCRMFLTDRGLPCASWQRSARDE